MALRQSTFAIGRPIPMPAPFCCLAKPSPVITIEHMRQVLLGYADPLIGDHQYMSHLGTGSTLTMISGGPSE